MKPYEYLHIVSLDETNVMGNVYFANHVRWQGRCREMFLKDHAQGTIKEFSEGLYLVTTRVSCEYFEELRAFDEVLIRMFARDLAPGRLTMTFEYVRLSDGGPQLIARGEQQIASMREAEGRPAPCPLPTELREAFQRFQE